MVLTCRAEFQVGSLDTLGEAGLVGGVGGAVQVALELPPLSHGDLQVTKPPRIFVKTLVQLLRGSRAATRSGPVLP